MHVHDDETRSVPRSYPSQLGKNVPSSSRAFPHAPARRNSVDIKGKRRVSQLRSGACAYPHSDVPDDVLYRHCSDQVPPVVRMKYLLNWSLHRSTAQALGDALPLHRIRPGRQDAIDALLSLPPAHVQAPVSKLDRQKYAEAAPVIMRVIDETLKDLNDGMIGISWLQQSRERPQQLQPHPRNESNTHAEQQLQGMLAQLEGELHAWNAQEHAIDILDSETEALTLRARQLRGRKNGDGDEDAMIMNEAELAFAGKSTESNLHPALAWRLEDVDEATRSHLEYALGVLHDVEDLNSRVARGEEADNTVGSDLEFSADKLDAQLYPAIQLNELAHRYLAQVSARASQTLGERATAGLATFSGTDTLSRVNDSDASVGQSDVAQQQQRLDALMAGVRDTCPADESDTSAVSHSDTLELLRALASRVDNR